MPVTKNVRLVADINPGGTGSLPFGLTVLDELLYFAADNGTIGRELLSFDPLTGEVSVAADIWTGSTPDPVTGVPIPNSSNPTDLAVLDDQLYFGANNGTNGQELYRYNPIDGAVLAANINPADPAGSNPTGLTVLEDFLYFAADDGIVGRELFRYDPVGGTATLVANINLADPAGSDPQELAVVDEVLLFSADDGVAGRELYSFDPSTEAVPPTRFDINPGPGSSNPQGFTVFQDELYFSANNGINGQELIRYDLLTETATVFDINTGPGDSNPTDLAVYRGEIYFGANDGTTGQELYSFDPVTETVNLVADINIGPLGSDPTDLTVYDGLLYFSADNGENGIELYTYDADLDTVRLSETPNPTLLNINPTGSSDPKDFTRLAEDLYFQANDGASGAELWGVDLEWDGTFTLPRQTIRDFTPTGGGWTSQNTFPRMVDDIDGDGLADIVGFGQDQVIVALADGKGSFTESKVSQLGDRGDTDFTVTNGGWLSQDIVPRQLGDIDGDDKADIVGFGQDQVIVALATEDGNFTESRVANIGDRGDTDFTVTNGNWFSQDIVPRMLGDIDGDGKEDIVGFGQDEVIVALATEDGNFEASKVARLGERGGTDFTVTNGGWLSQDLFPRMLGDINGDGKDDIVGFGQDAVIVALATEDGNFTESKVAEGVGQNFTVNGGWTSQNQFPRKLGDFNGDGKADIIGFGESQLVVSLATEDGNFTEAQIAPVQVLGSDYTVENGGWSSQELFTRMVDDIDGDSRADIVGFGQDWVLTSLS